MQPTKTIIAAAAPRMPFFTHTPRMQRYSGSQARRSRALYVD
jgi:hypothetical protein